MPPVVRSLWALFLSNLLMTMGVGLGNVLIPLRAASEGWSSAALAWIGTAYGFAFTAGCLVIPVLVRRVGHIRVFAATQTVLCATMLLFALAPDPIVWALVRAAGGFALVGGYMVVESWINERTRNDDRGSAFSAYMVVSISGILIGQFLLSTGDVRNEALFMVAALAFAVALLPVALSATPSPNPPKVVSLDIRALFRRSPTAVVGTFFAGVIYGNWSYFGPIYGREVGLSPVGIATMLTATMVGGVVFQFPFGKLSDRIDRRRAMALAGAVGAAVSVAMIVLAPRSAANVTAGAFALGSVLLVVYSLSVAHANDHAAPDGFVQVSGGLLVVYGTGNMVGPQLGGRLMDALGPEGFFVAMGTMFALYGAYAFWRSTRKARPLPKPRSAMNNPTMLVMQTPATLEIGSPAVERSKGPPTTTETRPGGTDRG